MDLDFGDGGFYASAPDQSQYKQRPTAQKPLNTGVYATFLSGVVPESKPGRTAAALPYASKLTADSTKGKQALAAEMATHDQRNATKEAKKTLPFSIRDYTTHAFSEGMRGGECPAGCNCSKCKEGFSGHGGYHHQRGIVFTFTDMLLFLLIVIVIIHGASIYKIQKVLKELVCDSKAD